MVLNISLISKTYHPMSNNSLRRPQTKQDTASNVTSNVGMGSKPTVHYIILTEYEALHPTVVSKTNPNQGCL